MHAQRYNTLVYIKCMLTKYIYPHVAHCGAKSATVIRVIMPLAMIIIIIIICTFIKAPCFRNIVNKKYDNARVWRRNVV